MDRSENERQYRVVDQTLSMHASLRDTYRHRAFLLNIGLMATSITLCAFVFASGDVLSILGFTPTATMFGLGVASVVSLILSIVETRVDWDAVSCRHGDAVGRLSALKAKYRNVYAETEGNDPKKNDALAKEYARELRTIPAIPHSAFNRLKAEHVYKKLLSERIRQFPKTPVWFLRLQLRWEGFREACKRKPNNGNMSGKETVNRTT